MKFLLIILLWVSVPLVSLAQHWEKDLYTVDSLQIYSLEKEDYTFYINAGSQGLFIDKIKVVRVPGIRVKIINNTGKTITNNFRERDGYLMWYRTQWKATLEPGEEMSLISRWSVQGMPRVGIRKHIYFSYTMDSVKYNFGVKVWGEFIVDLEEQKRISDSLKAGLTPMDKVEIIRAPAFQKTRPDIQLHKRKFYYEGEQVNARNRKGFKEGKWITLYDNKAIKAQEFYPGNDYHWDSAYFYREKHGQLDSKLYHVKLSDTAIEKQLFDDRGSLYKTFLWNGEVILEPDEKLFYPSGEIKSVSYSTPEKYKSEFYPDGSLKKHTRYTLAGKMDTIKYYYNSGVLEKVEVMNSWEKPKRRTTYDEDGDLLDREDVYHRNKISLRYLVKTDTLYVVHRYYNGKHSWTDRGIYKNDDLWEGTRISTQGGIYSLPKVFTAGRENGFYYKDEWVNQSDSLRQQGKWLKLHKSGSIMELAGYKNGVRDSLFTYFENGDVRSIHYSRGPFSPQRREKTSFYADGTLQYEENGFAADTLWVSYYPSGKMNQMKTRNGYVYDYEEGKICTYTLTIPKQIERSNSPEFRQNYYGTPTSVGPIEEAYKNCTLYQRTSSRYYTYQGIEGKERKATSYTIEKGSFINNSLNTGTRSYYDEKATRLRTVNVRNGKEI